MQEEKKTLTRSELEIIIKRRAAVLLIILAALVAVNSFFKDNVLLEQASVQDNKKTVKQILDEAGTTVTGFTHFEIGK